MQNKPTPKKLTLALVCLASLCALDSRVAWVICLGLMLVMAITQILQKWANGKFQTLRSQWIEFYQLKQLLSLLSIRTQFQSLFSRLSKAENIDDEEVALKGQKPFFAQTQSILEQFFHELDKLRDFFIVQWKSSKMMQSQFQKENKQAQKWCDIPAILNELAYNWIQMSPNLLWKFRVLERVEKCLQLAKAAQSAYANVNKDHLSKTFLSHQKHSHSLATLQTKLQGSQEFSKSDIEHYMAFINSLLSQFATDCTYPKKDVKNQQSVIYEIFSPEAKVEEPQFSFSQELMKTDIRTKSENFKQGEKEDFKAKLNHLLMAGWYDRQEKMKQLMEKEEQTQKLLQKKVNFDKGENCYFEEEGNQKEEDSDG